MKKKNVILFVEDDDNIRLSLKDFLGHKGYDVLVASDGVGAIKILIDTEIDLIVSDYRMDIFGGNYWIKFLQKFFPQMKVIITSGYLSQDIPIPYPILTKPYGYAKLVEKIENLLKEQ